jgi:acetyl-CoA C-acetyltransferase
MDRVYVIGIGSTVFGKLPDSSIGELAVKAASDAILEAVVDRKDIGALYLGNFVSGMLLGQGILAGLVADGLGLGQIPATAVEGACASGGIAFRHAYLSVASGQTKMALAIGAEKMTHASTGLVTSALSGAMDLEHDGSSGLTFPGLFGLIARKYCDRYGATRDDVSAVVRKNKANGLLNPLASMGAALTLEEIGQSRPISDPIRLFDCCPAGDGAAAILLANEDVARDMLSLPIEVLATVQTRGAPHVGRMDDLCSFGATVSASREAFALARVSPKDISFVELHDCFSIAEIVDSEDLGLVPRGHGAAYAAEGRTAVGGDIPINPSGGLLAKGHPVGATGLGQIYECVTQLRGTHANQVANAEFGMTHNLGGTGVACSVSIFRRGNI